MTEAKTQPKTDAGAAKKPTTPMSRKTLRKLGREKRTQKLRADKEFAKAFFEARSKRSAQKKQSFRKRHGKQQTVGK